MTLLEKIKKFSSKEQTTEKKIIKLIVDYLYPEPLRFRDKIARFSTTKALLKNINEPLCNYLWLDDIDIVAIIMDIERKFKIKIEDDYFLYNLKDKSLCATTLKNFINIVNTLLKIKKEKKNESKKRFRK